MMLTTLSEWHTDFLPLKHLNALVYGTLYIERTYLHLCWSWMVISPWRRTAWSSPEREIPRLQRTGNFTEYTNHFGSR